MQQIEFLNRLKQFYVCDYCGHLAFIKDESNDKIKELIKRNCCANYSNLTFHEKYQPLNEVINNQITKNDKGVHTD